jgi:endoglucanase
VNSHRNFSSTIGSKRLTGVTNWARNRNAKLLLGEFAGGNNAGCNVAITDMLNYIHNNDDVWLGWTW